MASISETGYTFNRETIHTRIANTMSGVTAATTDNKSVTAILFSFALYPNLVQKSEKIVKAAISFANIFTETPCLSPICFIYSFNSRSLSIIINVPPHHFHHPGNTYQDI